VTQHRFKKTPKAIPFLLVVAAAQAFSTTCLADRTVGEERSMEQPTPEPILKTALGFMAAKFLFVAEEIGLFEALADAPGNLEQVARRISVPARTARMVADAIVSLGLLEKQDGIYRNGASAAAFLSGRPDTGLRPALRFFNRISYRYWTELEDAIRAGRRPSKWGQMS
jgi:hypothetical protein